MNNGITIFIVPAAIALIIKLFVLLNTRSNSPSSSMFFTMVLVFAIHNIAEVFGFIEYFRGEGLTNILRWYYVMSVCALTAMLFYTKEVSKVFESKKIFNAVVLAYCMILSSLILFTDMVVSGSVPIGYIMTAVKGSYYWLFQISSLVSFFLILWMLVEGYRTSDSHLSEIRCGYTLVALAPLMLVGVLVILLMAIGVHINAAGILPVMTTVFLLITLKSEAKHGLTDIRRHIPYSLERQTSRKIMDIFSSYAKDELNYRDSMAEIEKMLVMHKHDKNDGNVSVTARTMDIPRSSLYSIFRRLEITHKD